MRVNKKFRDIRWDGPKASEASNNNMEEVKEEEKKGDEENQDPSQETEGFNRKAPAPFLYVAQFNHKQDSIMAAGAGANEMRIFDYESGNVLCVVS